MLDGLANDFSESDKARRNTISNLLGQKPIFEEEQESARTANISKVVSGTGWNPRFSLEQGVKDTLSMGAQ